MSPSSHMKIIYLLQYLIEFAPFSGEAYMALSSYECAKALQLFQRLPPSQYNTSWVLCMVGRAHFELADYSKSTTAFAEAHRLSPNNLEASCFENLRLHHYLSPIPLPSPFSLHLSPFLPSFASSTAS